MKWYFMEKYIVRALPWTNLAIYEWKPIKMTMHRKWKKVFPLNNSRKYLAYPSKQKAKENKAISDPHPLKFPVHWQFLSSLWENELRRARASLRITSMLWGLLSKKRKATFFMFEKGRGTAYAVARNWHGSGTELTLCYIDWDRLN